MNEQWSCGHVAGSMCQECYRELARRSNKLAEQLFELNDEIERLRAENKRLRDEIELMSK